MTFNVVKIDGVFQYEEKRANQVSLFDTNLKQQKFAFLKGFFLLMREKTTLS